MIPLFIASLAARLLAPTAATCGPLHWLNGVRPSGEYECRHAPVGDDSIGPHGEYDTSSQPPGVIHGRIYCTGRTRPVVIDERRAACR